MLRKVLTIATVATLSMGALAPTFAMDQEHSMLVSAVESELRRINVDVDNIDVLTLGDIAELKALLSGDSMSEAQQRNAARKIIDDAVARN